MVYSNVFDKYYYDLLIQAYDHRVFEALPSWKLHHHLLMRIKFSLFSEDLLYSDTSRMLIITYCFQVLLAYVIKQNRLCTSYFHYGVKVNALRWFAIF